MNHNKATIRYHLLIIALLLISNAFVFSIMVSQEKKEKELESQMKEMTEYDQYSEDIWYSIS